MQMIKIKNEIGDIITDPAANKRIKNKYKKNLHTHKFINFCKPQTTKTEARLEI